MCCCLDVCSGKSLPSSDSSERAASVKRDGVAMDEKHSPDSKASQVGSSACVTLHPPSILAGPPGVGWLGSVVENWEVVFS